MLYDGSLNTENHNFTVYFIWITWQLKSLFAWKNIKFKGKGNKIGFSKEPLQNFMDNNLYTLNSKNFKVCVDWFLQFNKDLNSLRFIRNLQ